MTLELFSRDIVPILQLIITTVGLGSLLLFWWQIRADHKRSRIEKACDLIAQWTSRIDKHSAMAAKLVEHLTDLQIRDIYDMKEVNIDKRWKSDIEACLTGMEINDRNFEEDGDHLRLEEKHCIHIRYLVENFLNITEMVLIPWLRGAADPETVEAEFRKILSPPSPFSLTTYRKITNAKEKFPAVEAFITYLIKKNEPQPAPGDTIA